MFQNLVTPTDYPCAMWGNQCTQRLRIGGDIVVVVRDTLQATWRRMGTSLSNQSCQQKWNRIDRGRMRRWIVEGKSLRGENEMEWDSDRDGDMDTESKTVWRRKFDRKIRE